MTPSYASKMLTVAPILHGTHVEIESLFVRTLTRCLPRDTFQNDALPQERTGIQHDGIDTPTGTYLAGVASHATARSLKRIRKYSTSMRYAVLMAHRWLMCKHWELVGRDIATRNASSAPPISSDRLFYIWKDIMLSVRLPHGYALGGRRPNTLLECEGMK